MLALQEGKRCPDGVDDQIEESHQDKDAGDEPDDLADATDLLRQSWLATESKIHAQSNELEDRSPDQGVVSLQCAIPTLETQAAFAESSGEASQADGQGNDREYGQDLEQG